MQGLWRHVCGGDVTERVHPRHCSYESCHWQRPKPTLRHHVDEAHRNDEERPRFKMEVLRVFGGDALLRQVSEAVQIREESGQMNRQQEWRQIQLPHLGLVE